MEHHNLEHTKLFNMKDKLLTFIVQFRLTASLNVFYLQRCQVSTNTMFFYVGRNFDYLYFTVENNSQPTFLLYS